MHKMLDLTTWSTVRSKVLERDSHKCLKCGRDMSFAEKEKAKIYSEILDLQKIIIGKLKRGLDYNEIPEDKERVKLERRSNYLESHIMIVDHILPIAMGGDVFNHDNLQTFCERCNKIKTRYDLKTMTYYRRCSTDEQRKELAESHLKTIRSVGLDLLNDCDLTIVNRYS